MQSLYFIAITPDDIVSEKITEIKNIIAKAYFSMAALRLPPHITLFPPFKWDDCNENPLFNSLTGFAKNRKTFTVSLNGFGCFETRVLYNKIETCEELIVLHKELLDHLMTEINLFDKQNERLFRPHITLASKDLQKDYFYKAWKEFKDKDHSASFAAENLALFKHDGMRWNIYERFYFSQ